MSGVGGLNPPRKFLTPLLLLKNARGVDFLCTYALAWSSTSIAKSSTPLMKFDKYSHAAKKTNEWILNKAGVKRELLDRQSKEASILWSHHEETRELPGVRDNASNNARCTKARKATHGLDGQHQDVDRTVRGRVNQNDRGQG